MDILPEVGGHYRLIMKTPDFSSFTERTFLIVEPNSHVRYTCEWNLDGEVSELDVTFFASEQGTIVVIEHSWFRKLQSTDMHHQVWDNYIKGFNLFFSNQD